jgi:hypothetical protein
VRGDFVAARTFEDSTGTVWEVFEVRRSSQRAQAVSVGLEHGWLAFTSSREKRRLAPFPPEWETADVAELERLCGIARAARNSTLSNGDTRPVTPRQLEGPSRARVPRIRPTRGDRPVVAPGELPIVATATSGDSVEATVRAFAHQARAHGLPAIEAMVRLKALLTQVFVDGDSPARDVRAVRRWFVEAYYFEREVPRVGADSQSR